MDIKNKNTKESNDKIDTESYNKLVKLENKHKVTFSNMVYVFILCATLGWLVEILYVFLVSGKIVSRGITYGPYCSIYGFGAVILYIIFHNITPNRKNIPYVFFVTSIAMGTFELVSGLGFKHIFNIEMWSYDGQFLEILNYTTVPILIGWGILGTIFVFLIQPIILKIISLIPQNIVKCIATIIIVIYFVDISFSIFNIHVNPEVLYKLVDPNL